jgi:hypothetical protein
MSELESYFVVIASEAKQSRTRAGNLSLALDCSVAEPVIGRAFARPGGAMTEPVLPI